MIMGICMLIMRLNHLPYLVSFRILIIVRNLYILKENQGPHLLRNIIKVPKIAAPFASFISKKPTKQVSFPPIKIGCTHAYTSYFKTGIVRQDQKTGFMT